MTEDKKEKQLEEVMRSLHGIDPNTLLKFGIMSGMKMEFDNDTHKEKFNQRIIKAWKNNDKISINKLISIIGISLTSTELQGNEPFMHLFANENNNQIGGMGIGSPQNNNIDLSLQKEKQLKEMMNSILVLQEKFTVLSNNVEKIIQKITNNGRPLA